MRETFSTPLQASSSKLFNWQLVVPADITALFLKSPTKTRVVCVLNGEDPHQCALTPIGSGVYVIKVNQERIKKLRLQEGKVVTVELFPDDSRYGLPMPAEMQAVLDQDEDGNRIFHALSPGKLRTMLYIAGSGKNSDDRIRLAVAIIEHLKARNGKIDFKALYYDIQ
ncbi:MAG: DUF1905 domain-containing protein [Saprospiraceae bacterium]